MSVSKRGRGVAVASTCTMRRRNPCPEHGGGVHADPRGSIVAVTDYQGNTLSTNAYDEYGIPDAATQAAGSAGDIATKGRFRYTGQAYIPELGMYYYKPVLSDCRRQAVEGARIYSPTLGRFLQTDPFGYEDQFNLYAYVGNDPVNGTDPTGMCANGTKVGQTDGSDSCDLDENGFHETYGDTEDGAKKSKLVESSSVKLADRLTPAQLDEAVNDEIYQMEVKVKTLTENSKFSREYGFVVFYDKKTNSLNSAVYAGHNGSVTMPLWGDRASLQASGHTHNGLVASLTTTFQASQKLGIAPSVRKIIDSGPSPDDRAASRALPGVKLFIYQQKYLGYGPIGNWNTVRF